jgi:hypothetical protein
VEEKEGGRIADPRKIPLLCSPQAVVAVAHGDGHHGADLLFLAFPAAAVEGERRTLGNRDTSHHMRGTVPVGTVAGVWGGHERVEAEDVLHVGGVLASHPAKKRERSEGRREREGERGSDGRRGGAKVGHERREKLTGHRQVHLWEEGVLLPESTHTYALLGWRDVSLSLGAHRTSEFCFQYAAPLPSHTYS